LFNDVHLLFSREIMNNQKLLLITPPFTQLNTPYPATAYIKGFLNTQQIESAQLDLGILTILKLFSKDGLSMMFQQAKLNIGEASDNSKRIMALHKHYIQTIDPVINFLQDGDPTLAHLICERQLLPEASKFEELEDLDWAFGTMGIRDQARHIATLYLEDIGDFMIETIDPHFGFSRYAERLSIAAHSFDELYDELNQPISFINDMMLSILDEQIKACLPTVFCMSIPFPGNLFAGLTCGKFVKQHYPHVKIIMGGGYPNTELRSLSDPRVFEFVDHITLDDGEAPLMSLLSYFENQIDRSMLKRTLCLSDGAVIYENGSLLSDIKQEKVGTPDYAGLPLKQYLSVIQLTNPMHRLWSDGRWNKLTMAHGCYWGKCTFCDISLDYIKNYEGSTAMTIVNRMEELINQTGESGFHFVDEAAPPSLMKAVALEILKRNLVVNWWTNIRFEKSFHLDLCRLLASSGCIAVSGGLEVASDRLLKLIAKGVTIEQVARVNQNFNEAGIMVHAYLMYGFPTQTDQETIDSLEIVRQMFEAGVLQSAFWHRFAMTAHSPVGINPENFKVESITNELGSFANNDKEHTDATGGNHDIFSEGLKASLYNYMHGVGLDLPLAHWFDQDVPQTSLAQDVINSYIEKTNRREVRDDYKLVWIGGAVQYDIDQEILVIYSKQYNSQISIGLDIGRWLEGQLLKIAQKDSETLSYQKFRQDYLSSGFEEFGIFWFGQEMEQLKEIGLLLV